MAASVMPHRWNSTLAMVSRLLCNREAVQATLDQQNHRLVLPTEAEWAKLQRLELLLEPCKYVTELLGGEAYVSCSVVLPAFRHLYRVMDITDDDPAYVVKFKNAFQKDLAARRANGNEIWFEVATALDPRFKDLKCLPREKREQVWTILENMLQAAEPRRADSLQPSTEDDGPAQKKRRSELLLGSDSDSEDGIESGELQRYRAEPSISIDDCPLQWWLKHNLPVVSHVPPVKREKGEDDSPAGVSQIVSANKGECFPLKKPAGATLRKAGLEDTVYKDNFLVVNGWGKFYLPKVVTMQVIGVVEGISYPCEQLVLMTCEDQQVYAYDEEELHLVASSMKQLRDEGMEYPGSTAY